MPVPVHVLSGFLGTGKTTALLAQIDARRDERIAVLVNDFGEAAIDQEIIGSDGTVALTEIRGACVCCTAPEGFTDALGVLLDDVAPDRIFVEPTGLARPADLVDTIARGPHRDRVVLGPVVVLVDPHTLGETDVPIVRDQVEAADVLVANRVDLATDDEVERFRAWTAKLWPAPLRVIETAHGRLPRDAFEWPEDAGLRLRRGRTRDRADKGVLARSWIWPGDVVFDRERLADAVARLATGRAGARLARLKGLFRTAEGVYLVEVAGGRLHDRPSGHRRDSRVDVVMEGGDPAPLDLAGEWLSAARMSEEELRVDPERLEVVRPDGTRAVLGRTDLIALPDGVPDIAPLVPGRAGAAARVSEVLDKVGVPLGAEAIVVAADGYATPPVPVEALLPGLLVHSVDGDPLPDGKGGPFRLFIPGDAGPGGPCANVKGVVRIALRIPG